MCRKIAGVPPVTVFAPSEQKSDHLAEITLSLEEFEALRLGDWLGLYHDECARQMEISRQTFGNIITMARQKLTGAIVNGWTMAIEMPQTGCPKHEKQCGNCNKKGNTCCKDITENDSLPCCGKRQKKCCKKMVEGKKENESENMYTG